VDWWREIEKGIEEADVFLFIISPDSATSKICGQEIDTAVKNGKRIIPIVTREIEWEDTPPQLGHLNYIFFSREDVFDTATNKLMTAIQTDYEWAATHRRLQVKALEWERNQKENGFLLRGKDLQDAEGQLAANTSKEPHPIDLQREHIFASRKTTDRQRCILTGISVAGLIALAALAVFGFYQAGEATKSAATAEANLFVANTAQANAESAQATTVANEQEAKRQAQIALARQIAAQARSINTADSSKQTISTLLDIQSIKLFPNADATSFLINNNLSAPEVARMTHDGAVSSVAFSPNGNYVVSGGGDGTARVWEWQAEDLIVRICATMPRNLTRAEWAQYIGDALPYQAMCENLPIEPEIKSTPTVAP